MTVFLQLRPALFRIKAAGESRLSVVCPRAVAYSRHGKVFCLLRNKRRRSKQWKGLYTDVWRLWLYAAFPSAVASLEIYTRYCACAKKKQSSLHILPSCLCNYADSLCFLHLYYRQTFTAVTSFTFSIFPFFSPTDECRNAWKTCHTKKIMKVKRGRKCKHHNKTDNAVNVSAMIKHSTLHFSLSAHTTPICTPASPEHVCPLFTTQITTSPSWALKSSIHLMQGSGGKSFTFWKVRECGWGGNLSPMVMYMVGVDYRGEVR